MADVPPAEKPPASAAPSGLETFVDDVFGVDFKILRTLRDTVIRPGRVADAALANDHSRYTRPLRVFLALFAVQTLILGWVGLADAGTLSAMLASDPEALASAQARLAAGGSSLAEADEVIRRWSNWSSWPVTAISSAIYMLIIWAVRSSLGPLKSFLLYVVATNASSLAATPLLLVGAALGTGALLATMALWIVVSLVYMTLVIHRRAADTALGLILRATVLLIATGPVLIAAGMLAFGAVELAFRAETGLWRFPLLSEVTSAPPGG